MAGGKAGSPPVDRAARAEIDALWDFADPAATEGRFRALVPEAEAAGDRAFHAELLSQLARTHSLRGEFEAAHRLLDEAEVLLDGEPTADALRARVRCLLERGRCHNSAGDRQAAVPLFWSAFEEARDAQLDVYTVDAAHMLGIAERPERRLAWNLAALALARASADERARRWQGTLHNNIGWEHHEAGRFDEALAHFQAGWDFRRDDAPAAEGTRVAKWTVARCLRSLGRTPEALAMGRELVAEVEDLGREDGFVCEEMAECLLALGEAEEAAAWFARAHRSLKDVDWLARGEPERLARLAVLGGVSAGDIVTHPTEANDDHSG